MPYINEQITNRARFMQKFNIRLNIAGKSYTLNIEREREEIFRRAEKEVNHLMAAVESQYMAEKEDYLAAIALQFAVKAIELESSRKVDDEMEALEEIDNRLGESLERLK